MIVIHEATHDAANAARAVSEHDFNAVMQELEQKGEVCILYEDTLPHCFKYVVYCTPKHGGYEPTSHFAHLHPEVIGLSEWHRGVVAHVDGAGWSTYDGKKNPHI